MPARSMVFAPAGTVTLPAGPAAVMRPSTATTTGLATTRPLTTSTICAAVITTVSAATGAPLPSIASTASATQVVFVIVLPL